MRWTSQRSSRWSAATFRTLVAAGCLALGMVGCATPPPEPESVRDPQADFGKYRTFGWTAAPAVDATDQPLLLLDRHIRAAIAAELTRRGYTEAPAGTTPDLRIVYATASAEKIENNPVRVGVGVGSWGGNVGGSINVGSPSIRNYREGTLIVHAVDSARNAEVWQGRVADRIAQGSLDSSAIAKAVAIAMRDFPVRGTQYQ
jgi:hypothetical protein